MFELVLFLPTICKIVYSLQSAGILFQITSLIVCAPKLPPTMRITGFFEVSLCLLITISLFPFVIFFLTGEPV